MSATTDLFMEREEAENIQKIIFTLATGITLTEDTVEYNENLKQ